MKKLGQKKWSGLELKYCRIVISSNWTICQKYTFTINFSNLILWDLCDRKQKHPEMPSEIFYGQTHFLLLFISSYISSPANKIKGKSSRSGEWGRRHHTSSVSTCLPVWRKRGSTDAWGAREMNVGEERSRLTALVQLPSFLFHFIVKEKNENTEKGNYLLSR